MGQPAKLLSRKTCLIGRAGRSMIHILAYYRKYAPVGKGLEGQNYLNSGPLGYVMDKLQIRP